jgi:hypothetical protein
VALIVLFLILFLFLFVFSTSVVRTARCWTSGRDLLF